MKAHDWVSEVEQPAPTETVSGQMEEQLGGDVSPGEMEENKTEGEQEEEKANRGEEERRGEEEKERDPRSVQVR